MQAAGAAAWSITDIGVLAAGPLAYSAASGINDAGQVVGMSRGANGANRAFLWTPGQGMVDLGDLPGGAEASTAWGVNDAGDIVGTGSVADSLRPYRAVLWRGAQMIDLGLLPEVLAAGWQLDQAMDINNAGQITGVGWLGGQQRGFVLSPVAAPVPEPASALLLACGAAWLAQLRRRRAATQPG